MSVHSMSVHLDQVIVLVCVWGERRVRRGGPFGPGGVYIHCTHALYSLFTHIHSLHASLRR
jgi:hypothetical protein